MINWFKRDISKDYKDRLRKAFPKALEKDLNVVFDVIPFSVNQVKLSDGNVHKVDNLIHGYFKNIKLEDEELSIPYRIYFNEPDADKEEILTESQKTILNCIYLKHHNGFIRQKRLERLEQNYQYWITSFTFQLLGEYVFEILKILDNQLDSRRLDNYKKFAIENPEYYQQTESRMISYWNEYYRYEFPKLKLYIGKIIFDQIKAKAIGKRQDEIIEIGIDENERLFMKPKRERFPLIYRTATEVHWSEKGLFLYSPKPREWSYYNWYRQIIDVIDKECNCKLILTQRTTWTNITDRLKKQIIENKKPII